MIGLAERLKREMHRVGFDLVGIARAGRAGGAQRLRSWIAAGQHGEMTYMARTAWQREDPRRVLPECRSVVVGAMSYHTGLPPTASLAAHQVWISRYAGGRDYHKILKKRLIRCGRWLDAELGGCAWRATVDTAPILERSWAVAAGIGWIGKNTMLLNRRFGSELFLGVLLTDANLETDAQVPAHCGRCTACLDACPTGALLEPGLLDARRCIAYLTVEHRSEIRAELKRLMGRHVAGCDLCQEVCPWNRKAARDLHPELHPLARRDRPNLQVLEALSEEEYRDWRAGSPLGRISYPMFRRNLSIARQNMYPR